MKIKKKNLISILMNCYNSEKYIKEAIESLRIQSFKDWRLIIWDDASEDRTLELVRKFNDDRIQIFENKKHSGLGAGRIKATKFLNSKYTSILDSDDVFQRDKLEKQINILESNKNFGLVASWYETINEKSKITKKTKINNDNKQIIENFLRENIFAHSSIIYRTDFAKNVGWYSNKYEFAQDYDLSLKLINKYNFLCFEKFLVKIRNVSSNMSNSRALEKTRILEKIKILDSNSKIYDLKSKLRKISNETIKIEKFKLLIIDFKKNFKLNCLFKILLFLVKNISIYLSLIKLLFKKLSIKSFN